MDNQQERESNLKESSQKKKKNPKQNKNSQSKAANETTKNKFKILMIHGYHQSGPIFESKTGSFRKLFPKSSYEFIFPTAPHQLVDADNEKLFGWWTVVASDLDDPAEPWLTSKTYKGLEDSIKFMRDIFEKEKPDVVVGFSQGGVLASILLTLGLKKDPIFQAKCWMMVSCFPATAEGYETERLLLTATPAQVPPTFFLYGEGDTLVQAKHTERLQKLFPQQNVSYYKHLGGHYIPTTVGNREKYVQFIKSYTLEIDPQPDIREQVPDEPSQPETKGIEK